MITKSVIVNTGVYLFLSSAILFFSSCHSAVATKPANAGLVAANIFFFDTIVKQFMYSPDYWPEGKIWYKDSFVVQELRGIEMEQDKQGVFRRKVVVNGYVFIDLRFKSFYEYKSFSDTAKLQKNYTQPDSVGINGGWNFYYLKPLLAEFYTPLSDTIIDGVDYKRFRLDNMNQTKGRSSIGYLRCDKKGSLLQYDRVLGKKLGCPIVRLDDFVVKKGESLLSTRIDFVRDNLTVEELKLFAAWEKNAKENPVQK